MIHKSPAQLSLLLIFHSSEQVLQHQRMSVGGRNYNPTVCQKEKNPEIFVNNISDHLKLLCWYMVYCFIYDLDFLVSCFSTIFTLVCLNFAKILTLKLYFCHIQSGSYDPSETVLVFLLYFEHYLLGGLYHLVFIAYDLTVVSYIVHYDHGQKKTFLLFNFLICKMI